MKFEGNYIHLIPINTEFEPMTVQKSDVNVVLMVVKLIKEFRATAHPGCATYSLFVPTTQRGGLHEDTCWTPSRRSSPFVHFNGWCSGTEDNLLSGIALNAANGLRTAAS
jgi:hypothetical protein